jgi:hypothetical protein
MNFREFNDEDWMAFQGCVSEPGMPPMIYNDDNMCVVYDAASSTVLINNDYGVVNFVPSFDLTYYGWQTFWSGVIPEEVDALWLELRGFTEA